MIYNIFGSKSSIDLDAIVFVEKLPDTIVDCHNMVEEYNYKLLGDFLDDTFSKKINCNLAVVKDGVIIDCFKGTPDELNNSILDTYSLHDQKHSCYVTRRLDRDVDRKVLRCVRIMLSFLTRTENNRKRVKDALNSNDLSVRLNCLSSINLGKIKSIGNKNSTFEDYLKVMAFQIAQTDALCNGIELYTKEDCGSYMPELIPFLNRHDNCDLELLNSFKSILMSTIDDRIWDMKTLKEY